MTSKADGAWESKTTAATAETAHLGPLTGRRGGTRSGHLHAFDLDECSVPIGNTCSALLLSGSGNRVSAALHLSSYLFSSSEHWDYSVVQ